MAELKLYYAVFIQKMKQTFFRNKEERQKKKTLLLFVLIFQIDLGIKLY